MSSLDHLTADQRGDLVHRYYHGEETVAALLKEFGIEVRGGMPFHLFPARVHPKLLCEWCGFAMETTPVSRSQFRASGLSFCRFPACPSCSHKNLDFCQCRNCRNAEQQLARAREEHKIALINGLYYVQSEVSVAPESLTARQRILVAALLRASTQQHWYLVGPLNRFPTAFAPTESWTIRLLDELLAAGILAVSDGPLDAFTVADDGKTLTFNHLAVEYEVNIEPCTPAVGELLLSPPVINRGDPEEAVAQELWQEIAMHEVLQYLRKMVDEHNLRFPRFGDKTIATVKSLLHDFSTAQVNGFIWRSVMDACRLVQKGTQANRAANSIIGNMQRRGERILANGDERRNYRRDYECPQSVLSSTFFDRVVGVGDDGFNMPMADWLELEAPAISV